MFSRHIIISIIITNFAMFPSPFAKSMFELYHKSISLSIVLTKFLHNLGYGQVILGVTLAYSGFGRGEKMENVITERRLLPLAVAELLPADVQWAIENSDVTAVEEIRIKSGGRVWVCGGERNIALNISVSADALGDILVRAAGGSLYSAEESIKKGYVFAGNGVRVGVCGEWTAGGVRNITSLAIRIPRRVKIDTRGVRHLLDGFGMSRGLLVFSPPLGGKTSFLREAIRELASGEKALRVVAVDTRGELEYSLDGGLCVDILSRYPKREGIEIASRTLGAQVVVCDEIGAGETEAICELHGGGVPLLASAHAASLSDLLSRRGIDSLHRAGVFGAYLELLRGQEPPFKCHLWEDCRDI